MIKIAVAGALGKMGKEVVKAVLEAKSPKYQQLASFTGNSRVEKLNDYNKNNNRKAGSLQVEMLENETSKNRITRPIVIPSAINQNGVRKLIRQVKPQEESFKQKNVGIQNNVVNYKNNTPHKEESNNLNDENYAVKNDEIDINDKIDLSELDEIINSDQPKRGRGRPKKVVPEGEIKEDKPKRGRGRPRKNAPVEESKTSEEDDELIDLFNLDEKEDETSQEDTVDLFNIDSNNEEKEEDDSVDLFNLDDSNSSNTESSTMTDEDVDLFDLSSDDKNTETTVNNEELYNKEQVNETEIVQTQYNNSSIENLSRTLTKDKKVVCFVGTTKNGTSFIVNNAAHLLASMGISTAILDMTKTKNAYYIYTNSEEKLMNIAKNSINNLKSGIAEGIKINKNLSVYTSLPDDSNDYTDVDGILSTLVKNHSVVLIFNHLQHF